MVFTKASRDKDIKLQLGAWEPLIGSQAALTALRGLWWKQAGFTAILVSLVVGIPLQAIGWTGLPIVIVVVLTWPFVIVSFVRSFKLTTSASRQGGLVAGTSPKARPPVNTVDAFNRWRERSQYARRTEPRE